jgi:hypothetical protein
MNTSVAELSEKIAIQAARIASMYGGVDLSITPERFTVTRDDQDGSCPGAFGAATGTARQ